MNRKKKVIANSGAALLSEVVGIICGFILPRMILTYFGSSYNGLTSSITQFISYVALLRSGIGGVTRVALYKPLAEKNDYEISGIINATTQFMRRVALIFAGALVVYACVYPFLVSSEFDWLFTTTLVLIIGISTFAQYYFAVSFQMLLKADQREYVSLGIGMITTILNTIVASIIMVMGGTIHIVKLGSAVVFLLGPLLLNVYVRKHYSIDKNVPPDKKALSQRWDSFAHQIANFVHGNTDIIILTVFSNTLEISVYTVHYLVVNGVKKAIVALTTGLEAAFGNMIANNEKKAVRNNFFFFEWLVFNVSTILFTVTAILILPFIALYTNNVNDVSYSRPLFAYIIIAAEFFGCIRIPYETITRAAGHYRQTRNGAILEPVLNIIISVALVSKLGLVGVAIGTLFAMMYRTFQYTIYVSKNFIKRAIWDYSVNWLISLLLIVLSYSVCSTYTPSEMTSYGMWILYAIIDFLVVLVLCLLLNLIFERKMLTQIVGMIKKRFLRRKAL